MLPINDYFDILASLVKSKWLRMSNRAPAPRVMAYTVTWRCNASCDMCGIKNVDKNLKTRQRELTADDISKIFKDPLLRKLDLIRFTGGEPFLKEDFTDIVGEIISNTRTKIYYITTNGFYTERVFKLVERLAPRTNNIVIQISLDAVGRLHDDTRCVPGLYDKAIRTLEGLQNLKKKYNFSFGVNQTITPQTIDHMEKVSKLCKKYECEHKIYLAYEAHESDILDGEKLDSKLLLLSNPKREIAENLFSRIEEYYKKENKKRCAWLSPEDLWSILEGRVLKGSKNRILNERNVPNPPCLALFFYLRLMPDGTIMPCTMKPKPVGNLKNEPFSEIWNSRRASDIRSEIKKCKGCWVECDIVPNLIYSFDLIKEAGKRLITPLKKG